MPSADSEILMQGEKLILIMKQKICVWKLWQNGLSTINSKFRKSLIKPRKKVLFS